jgi:hypothetical protein
MQNGATLKPCLNARNRSVSHVRAPIRARTKIIISDRKPRKNVFKPFTEKRKFPLRNIDLRAKAFAYSHCRNASLSGEKHTNVNHCISIIKDPLWRHICQDVMGMMGPASALKIWKSKLGQLSAQDKILTIICENEETSAFVQQYDFVILGSLQKYFPALKQLNAETITALSH